MTVKIKRYVPAVKLFKDTAYGVPFIYDGVVCVRLQGQSSRAVELLSGYDFVAESDRKVELVEVSITAKTLLTLV